MPVAGPTKRNQCCFVTWQLGVGRVVVGAWCCAGLWVLGNYLLTDQTAERFIAFAQTDVAKNAVFSSSTLS